MYQVVQNQQFTAFDTRVSLQPPALLSGSSGLYHLGRHHTTNSFSIVPYGSISINYNNEERNDTFTITISMARISFNVDFNKNSPFYNYMDENKNCSVYKFPVYAISIGEIFKHYYKNHLQDINTITSKKKKKGMRKIDRENEFIDAGEENDEYIHQLIQRSLKVNTFNTDVRVLLGTITSWDSLEVKLWDSLLDGGFLKSLGNDFTSFCNTFFLLPIFHKETFFCTPLDEALRNLSNISMIRKLCRFFLFDEDPSPKGWVLPERDYFDEPISINDVLEMYSKDLYECEDIRIQISRQLNPRAQKEIEERYKPQTFDSFSSVPPNYPIHAIRSIYLLSWSSVDYDIVRNYVRNSSSISKSSRSRHIIEKRGKYESYDKYDVTYHYKEVRSRCNKFDRVHMELNM